MVVGRGGNVLWIVQMLLVFLDVISWVTGLLYYNERKFITLLYVRVNVDL